MPIFSILIPAISMCKKVEKKVANNKQKQINKCNICRQLCICTLRTQQFPKNVPVKQKNISVMFFCFSARFLQHFLRRKRQQSTSLGGYAGKHISHLMQYILLRI